MASPIAETPVLRGKDAKRFREHMKETETRKVTLASIREYKAIMANYKAIRKLAKF